MKNNLIWISRIIPAIILLQTLFFKFTAHPDSVMLFTKLGAEPYGRIILGIIELITSALILYPKTTFYGSLSGLLIMIGAIISHLTIIGINYNGDGGTLFTLAVITAIFCLANILITKNLKARTVLAT